MLAQMHNRLKEVVVPKACESAQVLIDALCKYGLCQDMNACTASFDWMLSIYMLVLIGVAMRLRVWRQHLLTVLFAFVVPAMQDTLARFVDVAPASLILYMIVVSLNWQKKTRKTTQKSDVQSQLDDMQVRLYEVYSKIVGPPSAAKNTATVATSPPVAQRPRIPVQQPR